ncbi:MULTISPECIES: ogr/Delta-like zinc finger family protein [Vibrio]|uniref:ogr/Delta-like zinc finger family protein n=1 Tax=Vibrio TaxID=662 RepID=UPI000B5C2BFF|nr:MULTISPECIES: ogr/Delta-like zinc finger family protein [Vibrio]HBV77636.1 zinc-binding protein [Vibrio sp.]
MLVTCPVCLTKTRIATSRAISSETRELYCQCLNLNCGTSFVSLISLVRIIKPTGKQPDIELQPELRKNGNQMDIFEERRA